MNKSLPISSSQKSLLKETKNLQKEIILRNSSLIPVLDRNAGNGFGFNFSQTNI